MTDRVLFLDIDGVVLPGRAYTLPNQTNNPYVTVFDPCAVAMLNRALEKQGRKLVVHSSWVKHQTREWLLDHLIRQGIRIEHFHEDWYTEPKLHWRYDRVRDWLARHKECKDFFILDDEPLAEGDLDLYNHFIQTDFDEGITVKIFHKILDGVAPRRIGLDNG